MWVGPGWRIAHCINCALPGWLVLLPRRHVTSIADLTAAEAVELGSLTVAASTALHEVTGCAKTYVMQFAEAEGFAHTHFHLVPRPTELPAERRGPAIFWYLDRPAAEHVPRATRDDLASRLTPAIARALA